ncbi:hypothetical protein FACS189460_1010 [Deltaproteobacteria bacterium]|nr:hypothetical protein FACS189460_1010 [Deltaproteobacteria bacterium]
MASLDYTKTRFLTLTFDRTIYGQGQAAYYRAKAEKPVGRFMQNLARHGVKIEDWTCNLEFHRDGTPHFHLLVQVDKPGYGGQIGQAVIHECWPFGRIHETYFKTEADFQAFLGYLNKTGYLTKNKDFQGELPGWALDLKKVNRFSSKKKLIPDYHEDQKAGETGDNEDGGQGKNVKTYRDRHGRCGQAVAVSIVSPDGHRVFHGRFALPYQEAVKMMEGEFYPGVGFVIPGDVRRLLPAFLRFARAASQVGGAA